MTAQSTIETKLAEALSPLHLEVINESGNHNVPPGSESHFKVVLVAAEFEGQRLIARHRRVNGVLADELANSIHALALHTYTGSRNGANASAPRRCRRRVSADRAQDERRDVLPLCPHR